MRKTFNSLPVALQQFSRRKLLLLFGMVAVALAGCKSVGDKVDISQLYLQQQREYFGWDITNTNESFTIKPMDVLADTTLRFYSFGLHTNPIKVYVDSDAEDGQPRVLFERTSSRTIKAIHGPFWADSVITNVAYALGTYVLFDEMRTTKAPLWDPQNTFAPMINEVVGREFLIDVIHWRIDVDAFYVRFPGSDLGNSGSSPKASSPNS